MIKPQFRTENGEIVFCPHIGLGEKEISESISIPFFIKDNENIFGTYKLNVDGFFYKVPDETANDLIITIEVDKRWGLPKFTLKVLGFEAVLYLPSIKVINQKRQVLYSYLHIPEILLGLEKELNNYLKIEKLSVHSFNFGAVNYTGDELVRKNHGLEDQVDTETGFSKRCKVSENHRLQLKKEFNFIELFKMIASLMEKQNIFEDNLEQARTFAKEVEEKAEDDEKNIAEKLIEEVGKVGS